MLACIYLWIPIIWPIVYYLKHKQDKMAGVLNSNSYFVLATVSYKTNNECFHSCNGKNIFIRWKMEFPFRSWKYSYHCTHKHSLLVYCTSSTYMYSMNGCVVYPLYNTNSCIWLVKWVYACIFTILILFSWSKSHAQQKCKLWNSIIKKTDC